MGQARADGHHRVDHRLDLRRALGRTRVPIQLEPQRVLHLDDTRAREVESATAGAGVGRETVDVGHGESGVGDRGACGLDGEVDARAVEASTDVGLADSRDDGLPLEGAHDDTGRNNGR